MLFCASKWALLAAVVLSATAAMPQGEEGPPAFKGRIDWSLDSACVSKGRTVHDAPVTCMRGFLSDFRVCDTTIPSFVGCVGKLSISNTERYPREKPGKWVELDPTAGFEWSRYLGLEDDFRLANRWFRWTYPSARGKDPSDAAILDVTYKTFLNPTVSVWYRFHGPTKGRVEVLLSLSEESEIWEKVKVFGLLNTWFIDYYHENADKESGASAGEFALGLSWRWFYFKTTYWFPLDRRVLSGDNPTYDYDKNLIFTVGVRVPF